MVRQLPATMLLALILTGAGFGQMPQPAAGASRIYVLLKPTLTEPGASRDAFAQRMAALGAINLQFVTGANAVRCDVPATAQASIAADTDVAAVLPMDTAATASATPAPVASPVASAPVPQVPLMTTPPYIQQQPNMPIAGGMPVGSGMGVGMAMLTDFAAGMVVKMLTPNPGCKIKVRGTVPVVPATGGAGAFEVTASGNCAWQAVSTADWLQVKTEVNATGTVAVQFTATRNASGHRQAAVMIQPVAGMAPVRGHAVMMVGQQ